MDAKLARIFGGIIWLLLAMPLLVNAQQSREFDTTFANSDLKEFFLRNSSISRLETSTYNTKWLTVFFKSKDEARKNGNSDSSLSEYYNLGFEGDRYFFKKRFGSFQLPDYKLPAFVKFPNMQEWHAEYKITADSVKCNIEYYLKPDKSDGDDYDRIFTKVERKIKYIPGLEILNDSLESRWKKQFLQQQISTEDSVAILRITITKKGCVEEVVCTEGKKFPYLEIIAEGLKNNCSWTPYQTGGMLVTYRFPMFVRIKPDLSLKIYIPE